MNKKEFIKKQTRKNFVQQKVLEVLIILAIIFLPFFVGNNLGDGQSGSCTGEGIGQSYYSDWGNEKFDSYHCRTFDTWMEGLGWITLTLAALAILFIIVLVNWEWAEERAEKKYNDVKKVKQK